MSSLDLNTLNNIVVSLRGPVTQAKVHVIHKLTRQVSKLRAKKGTEEQKVKNVRKAERLVQEIKVLKETEKDSMAKFAFRNRKTVDKVEVDDFKVRALVRLSCHEILRKKVSEIRDTYPNWEKEEQSLFARMGRVQAKKSLGVKMAKQLKQKTKLHDKKKTKKIKESTNNENSESGADSDQNDSSNSASEEDDNEVLGEEEEDEEDEENGHEKPLELQEKKSLGFKKEMEVSDDDEEHYDQIGTREHKNKEDDGNGNSEEGEDDNTDGDDEAEESDDDVEDDVEDNEAEESDDDVEDNEAEESDDDVEDNEAEESDGDVEDSDENEAEESDGDVEEGFITSLLKASRQKSKNKRKPLQKEEEEEGPKNVNQQENSKKIISKRVGEMEVKTLNLDEMEPTDSEEEDESKDIKVTNGVSNTNLPPKDSFFLGGQSSSEEEEEEEPQEPKRAENGRPKLKDVAFVQKPKLPNKKKKQKKPEQQSNKNGNFPNRAARRRQEFGNVNDTNKKNKNRNSFNNKKVAGGRKNNFEPESKKLHPSWEAKRKSSSGIEKFQGKKFKFDENERENSAKQGYDKKSENNKKLEQSSSSLHPSWAAKKEQKKIQIAQFQGKKISFE